MTEQDYQQLWIKLKRTRPDLVEREHWTPKGSELVERYMPIGRLLGVIEIHHGCMRWTPKSAAALYEWLLKTPKEDVDELTAQK